MRYHRAMEGQGLLKGNRSPDAIVHFTLTYEKEAFIRAYFRNYPAVRPYRYASRSF